MAVGNDAKPTEHTTEDGQTFYNAALTGSGTILPDGTYGEPEPDPTVKRGGISGGRDTSGGRTLPEPRTVADEPAQRTSSTTQSTKRGNQK